MRIAFVSQPWTRSLPPSDSIAIWNLEVGRRLAAAGHEVSIFGPALDGQPRAADHEGVELRGVDLRGDERAARLLARVGGRRLPAFATAAFHPRYAVEVGRGVRAWGADVVHLHNFSQWVPLARLMRPKAKVVLHMHCEWLRLLAPRTVARRARRADLILGASEFISRGNRRALPDLADRCVTVPNGVDVERFARPRPDANPEPAGSRLIAIGRISPEKGTHRLLEAYGLAQGAEPGLELEVVGTEAPVPPEMLIELYDDPLLQALGRFGSSGYLAGARRALSPDAAAGLELVGEVPHAGIPERLARADVLVAASLTEAFGMPLIEAMAAGLPVVASDAGGMREVVDDRETGLLVARDDPRALADAILELVRDRDLRHRLGAAGRERAVQRYSWDVVVERLLAAYDGHPGWNTAPR